MSQNEENSTNQVAFALVHHANQFLITDGYDSRQGISEIVEGYSKLLRLHEKVGLPCNLHLSGTLIEAIAWHAPWFFDLVKKLMRKGLVALLGGTYSENVMTQFSPSFNRRQLEEYMWLARRHLDCEPVALKIAWVPERVWNTNALAPVLTDPGLANGGYRYVLLDDRLIYPVGHNYCYSPRASFDATGPYGLVGVYNGNPTSSTQFTGQMAPAETSRVYRLANSNGLNMIPISANIRYWVPPGSPGQWQSLEETVKARLQDGDENTLLVYADDLEKTAGIAGWDSAALGRYEAFLNWLARREQVTAVLLPDWLESHPARNELEIEPGTFFEIAQEWKGGEDYRGWAGSPAWQPYRETLDREQALLQAAEMRGGDQSLLKLASKHLLASAYETAWHDPSENGRSPAGWARATANHARAARVIIAAANWFARTHSLPQAAIIDIDGDGEDEAILCNNRLYAVLSPLQGGRLIYLFIRDEQEGVMVIGNPTDDWNFLEKTNEYMQVPPNHPGALVDQGFELDKYSVRIVGAHNKSSAVGLVMTNNQAGSPLFGAGKQLSLTSDAAYLAVCYELPPACKNLTVLTCLSPDYYRLLREGKANLRAEDDRYQRGYSNGNTAISLVIAGDERINWVQPGREQVGHGLNVAFEAGTSHFHLLIGCSAAFQKGGQELLEKGRGEIHGGNFVGRLLHYRDAAQAAKR